MNRRGINMVVVDQEGKVLDVVNYDSYVSDEVVTHRWWFLSVCEDALSPFA